MKNQEFTVKEVRHRSENRKQELLAGYKKLEKQIEKLRTAIHKSKNLNIDLPTANTLLDNLAVQISLAATAIDMEDDRPRGTRRGEIKAELIKIKNAYNIPVDLEE